MQQSLLSESVISLADAAKSLPLSRGGKPLNFTTLWRWHLKGVIGPNGERVKLEAAKLGGKLITSREAIVRFSEALSGAAGHTPDPSRTAAAGKRAAEVAQKKLERLGI